MTRPFTTRLGAVAALGACLVALAAGSDALPTPPAHPIELLEWWSSTDSALALGGLLRMSALVSCGWLLTVTTIELLATASGWRTLARVARRAAPAAWQAIVLRPLTAGTLAVPLLAPMAGLAPAVAVAQPADLPTPESTTGESDLQVLTMTLLSESDPSTAPHPEPTPTSSTTGSTTTTSAAAVPPPTVVVTIPEDLHEHPYPDEPPTVTVPPDATAPTPAPPPAPTRPPASSAPDPTPTAPGAAADTYTVVPGDSFWRIAAVRVESHLGRVPEPSEIASYWRQLIAANEGRLAVPGNPDLIFPGDELVLPDV